MTSRLFRPLVWRRPVVQWRFAALGARHISMTSAQKTLVAVCQMTAINDKEINYETCKDLIRSASNLQAKMVFLPEACDYIGETKPETVELAEPLDGPLLQRFKNLAKRYRVWLSLGGVHEKTIRGKISNSHVIIDDKGAVQKVYRKVHLFDVDIPEKGTSLRESDFVTPGEEIVLPFQTPIGKLGLGICYDIRFPEFGLMLANMGAEILTYPSAFTFATGSAHWEVLLRARAIETQCFVIAAAQTGFHNKKRSSWGHAMIVDPWGNVIAQCSEGTNCVVANLDLSYIDKVRKSMPVKKHRRNDLYPKVVPRRRITFPGQDKYLFGETVVETGQVFLQTENTIGFTNKKCVVPGHVLVSPRKCVKRISDLDHEELEDLFACVQDVQKVVENKYAATSTTISIQDGPDAGQTVNHVHVHILPRRPGDFVRNDDVYVALEKEGGRIRSSEEMCAEAKELRTYFYGPSQRS